MYKRGGLGQDPRNKKRKAKTERNEKTADYWNL